MGDLKPGWKRWRFDEIATSVTDRVDDPSEAGVEYYVGLEHLDSDTLKIRRWGSPDDVSATKLLFEPGDIIFGRRRAYQRKLGVAEFRGIASAHSLVLRAKPSVALPEFLPFLMQSDLFMDLAQKISVGSLSPTINWKTLAKQEFALPPLEEQREVLKVLDAAQNTLDALTDTVRSARRLYDATLLHLYQSEGRLMRHTGDNSGSRSEWEALPLGQRYEVQLGKMMSKAAREGPNQVPYIRNANVQWNALELGDVQTMSFSERDRAKFELRHGDILACEGRHVGKSALWRDEIPGACYQKALHRLRRLSDRDEPEFLLHCLRYYSIKGMFVAETGETTIPHLPAERLRAMVFPFPPIEEQLDIVSIIREVDDALLRATRRESEQRSLIRMLTDLVLGSKP